jgi:hypothetical protein
LRLLEEQQRLGHSTKKFAKLLSKDVSNYRKMLHGGKRGFGRDVHERLAEIGVDVDYVYTGVRTPSPAQLEAHRSKSRETEYAKLVSQISPASPLSGAIPYLHAHAERIPASVLGDHTKLRPQQPDVHRIEGALLVDDGTGFYRPILPGDPNHPNKALRVRK